MNDDINKWENAFSAFENDFSLQDEKKEPDAIPVDKPEYGEIASTAVQQEEQMVTATAEDEDDT